MRRDARLMCFLGALFCEGGNSNLAALRDCGLGHWSLLEVVRIARSAAKAGVVKLHAPTLEDAGYWEVTLLERSENV